MQEDVVLLESIDAALIAHCLRHRYKEDAIYTWVGADHSVLVSVNPFKRLPIYGEKRTLTHTPPRSTSTFNLHPNPNPLALALTLTL
tara:strand:+ start:1691 stop:1951 length:261 start_codon:yes stop_codon:yes gene_type:complete